MSLISKICHVRIFGYRYVVISYYILDYQVRSCNCVIHQIQIRTEDLNLNYGRFVETFLCKYKLFLSDKIGDPLNRNTLIFQKPRTHLQISGVKMVPWSNSCTQIPQFCSNLFTSVLFGELCSVRLIWYVYMYIYAGSIRRRPCETYSYRRPATQDLYTLSSTVCVFKNIWQYGILPISGSGVNLGSFFRVEAWIM